MPIRRLIPDPIRRNVGPSGGVPGGGGGQFRGLLCGIGQVQKRAAFGIGWSSDTSLLEDASCKETGAQNLRTILMRARTRAYSTA